MSRLLVDIGNTRIKLALQDEGGLRALSPLTRGDAFQAELANAVGEGMVESIRVASVSQRRDARFIEALRMLGVPTKVVDCCLEGGPVSNAYAERCALGVDRWLAMVGAFRHAGGPLCVVDAGSAITLDAVAEDGRHLGGAILPGIHATIEAMRDLGLEIEGVSPRFGLGTSTASCVDAGVGFALRGAVHAVTRLFSTPPLIWITGGDGPLVGQLLQCDARRDPLLVLRGLADLEMEGDRQ